MTLFSAFEREPLYLLVPSAFVGILDWLSADLAVSVRFLMARLQLFMLRAFVTAKNFWLALVIPICFKALEELQPKVWLSLMHASTSPKPILQPPNPQLAARGLDDVRMCRNSDQLREECVGAGVDVEPLAADSAPDTQTTAVSVRQRESHLLVAPILQSLEVWK